MSGNKLEIPDLVKALEQFGDRYHAVDVFADDLSEGAVDAVKIGRFETGARTYRLQLFEEQGVVRLERVSPKADATQAAITGTVIGGAIAAASKQKGDGILGGALLGLLVGGILGSSSAGTPVQKVFAMQFDPRKSQWFAYDGDLLRWMKSRLLPTRPAQQG